MGLKNQDPHKYAKKHSGTKFVEYMAYRYILRCYKFLLERDSTTSEQVTMIRKLAAGGSGALPFPLTELIIRINLNRT